MGLTQQELAEKLMLKKYSISSYEKEKSEPNDEIKIRIAQFFHVSVDYLLGITDNPLPRDRETDETWVQFPAGLSQEKKELLQEFIAFLAK